MTAMRRCYGEVIKQLDLRHRGGKLLVELVYGLTQLFNFISRASAFPPVKIRRQVFARGC
jgi:hypothetical protein